MATNFYIFSNSPGEIFAWVRPLVNALNRQYPQSSLYVFLTPCQYASGQELQVCQQFPGVTHVYSPIHTIKQCMSPSFKKGVVFFMGGDPMYAKWFSKKTNSLLLGYTEHDDTDDAFDCLIKKSKNVDLMKAELQRVVNPNNNKVVLLPGSRPEHLLVALPIMLTLSANLKNNREVCLSPFTTPATVQALQLKYPDVSFFILKDPNQLSAFKYALTIPGTNTMQLAYLNVPYFMILPTHNPSILRLNGLMGLFLMIPFLGYYLKKIMLYIKLNRDSLYSLPNQFFNEKVCPEYIGSFDIQKATQAFDRFIQDQCQYESILNRFKELESVQSPLSEFLLFVQKSN